jgi:hypothetical protein
LARVVHSCVDVLLPHQRGRPVAASHAEVGHQDHSKLSRFDESTTNLERSSPCSAQPTGCLMGRKRFKQKLLELPNVQKMPKIVCMPKED